MYHEKIIHHLQEIAVGKVTIRGYSLDRSYQDIQNKAERLEILSPIGSFRGADQALVIFSN